MTHELDMMVSIAVSVKHELKHKAEEKIRYFISSLGAMSPKKLGGIENNLRWMLDQAFDEVSTSSTERIQCSVNYGRWSKYFIIHGAFLSEPEKE